MMTNYDDAPGIMRDIRNMAQSKVIADNYIKELEFENAALKTRIDELKDENAIMLKHIEAKELHEEKIRNELHAARIEVMDLRKCLDIKDRKLSKLVKLLKDKVEDEERLIGEKTAWVAKIKDVIGKYEGVGQ